MKFGIGLCFLSCLFLLVVSAEDDVAKSRGKRSVVSLGKMIGCTHMKSNKNVVLWAFTKYSNYGCYCGMGGKGDPVDMIDSCCYFHDRCYFDMKKKYHFGAYTDLYFKYKYSFKCRQDQVVCDGDLKGISLDLCKCDAQLSHCLAQYALYYNPANRGIKNKPKKCLKLGQKREGPFN